MKDLNDKYNMNPEENVPREIYGVFNPKDADKYNVEPEDNNVQFLYGVLDPELFNNTKNEKQYIDFYINDVDNNKSLCLSLIKENDKYRIGFYDGVADEYYNLKSYLKPISKETFENTLQRLKLETNDWLYKYEGEGNLEWNFHLFDGTTALITGKGAFPDNWNQVIAIISELESLYKTMPLEKDIDKENKNKYLASLKIIYSSGKNMHIETIIENVSVKDDLPLNGITIEEITEEYIKIKVSNFIGYIADNRIEEVDGIKDGFLNFSVVKDYLITLHQKEEVRISSMQKPGPVYTFKLEKISLNEDVHYE